jgi:acetoin utilization deacetylase AcuC-like enzyme
METTSSTYSVGLPQWLVINDIDKSLLSSKAIENMLTVHQEKYLAAWLNKDQHGKKIKELEAEYSVFSEPIRTRVEEFISSRKNNPSGQIFSEVELNSAVSVKIGLDAVKTDYEHACIEFDEYAKIIKQIKEIKPSSFIKKLFNK